MRRLLAVLLCSTALSVPAFAGSTINTAQPAQASAFLSSVVRQNFVAAANDINNILGMFSGASAPNAPTTGQDWLNTSTTPWVWEKWDGLSWVQIGTINATTHLFNPYTGISGLTQGSALFAGAAGAIAQDNAQFFWDDTNHRLGLGTAAPDSTLHVVGTSHLTGAMTIGGAVTLSSNTVNQLTVKSASGANPGVIAIDNTTGGNQSVLNFLDAGLSKWQIGKQTDNSFIMFDAAQSVNFLSVATNGNVTFGESAKQTTLAGGIAFNGTALPGMAQGVLGFAGLASAPTLGTNGEGACYLVLTTGLTCKAWGSNFDMAFLASDGTQVFALDHTNKLLAATAYKASANAASLQTLLTLDNADAGGHGSQITFNQNGTPVNQVASFYDGNWELDFEYNTASLLRLRSDGLTTFNGAVRGYKAFQSTKTSNYSVLASDTGSYFDNTGAVGTVIFTLPTAAAGLRYCFAVTAAQTLEVLAPASNKIAIGGTNSAAAGNIQSSTTLCSICLVATTVSNQWAADRVTGTWTVN